MSVSSADLLGTSKTQAHVAASKMDEAYDAIHKEPKWLDRLDACEELLVSALAELRAAKWGVTRRMPQFDDLDLDIVISSEMRAIRGASGLIPDQFPPEPDRAALLKQS